MKTIPIPTRMEHLPRDSKGRLVPHFVFKPLDGADPDFRIIGPHTILHCHRDHLCWVCGGKLGIHKAFVLGPMCAVNRVNSEPPSHYECAHYSVQVCPFLSTPKMTRREAGLPDIVSAPAGIAIYRNPGAAAIWVTRSYVPISDSMGGVLFRLGPPERVEWYAEGRRATRAEVLHSIDTGFPTLAEMAKEDGPKAEQQLKHQYEEAMTFLPVETTVAARNRTG